MTTKSWEDLGLFPGDWIRFEAAPPPWWRPIKRFLWLRRRKRDKRKADGVYRVVSVSEDTITVE